MGTLLQSLSVPTSSRMFKSSLYNVLTEVQEEVNVLCLHRNSSCISQNESESGTRAEDKTVSFL